MSSPIITNILNFQRGRFSQKNDILQEEVPTKVYLENFFLQLIPLCSSTEKIPMLAVFYAAVVSRVLLHFHSHCGSSITADIL